MMRTELLWLGLMLLHGLVSGCTMATEEVPAEPERSVARAEAPLLNARVGGGGGAVYLDWYAGGDVANCSGAVVGQSMIVTAAHCFDGLLPEGAHTGTVALYIRLALPDGSWSCITDSPSDGQGTCKELSNVTVYRFTGGRPDYDFAAVFPGTRGANWRNLANREVAHGLIAGGMRKDDAYVLFGRGKDSTTATIGTTMRFGTDGIDWINGDATYFINDAFGYQICAGDSGGPYLHGMLYAFGYRYIFGVASSGEKGADDCVRWSKKERGFLLHPTEMPFINWFRESQGYAACQQLPNSTLWDCP